MKASSVSQTVTGQSNGVSVSAHLEELIRSGCSVNSLVYLKQ